ncbi:hypothetical protein, partial [Mycobacterium sp.]|uniref:hypothetical protein n=1 Tax=Mycobacterium sp. TaxID=1785 RepID=UPI002BEDD704
RNRARRALYRRRTVLAAETIWVVLLKESDLRNPAATPIAIFLSMALLANLGIVCGLAATTAANSIRKPNYCEPAWSCPVMPTSGYLDIPTGGVPGWVPATATSGRQ